MAIYCKAFLAKDLQLFPGWTPNEMTWMSVNKNDGEMQAPQDYPGDAILYLHDNYVVTDGVLRDEKIVFDKVMPEWIEFCRGTLGFTIPEDVNKANV